MPKIIFQYHLNLFDNKNYDSKIVKLHAKYLDKFELSLKECNLNNAKYYLNKIKSYYKIILISPIELNICSGDYYLKLNLLFKFLINKKLKMINVIDDHEFNYNYELAKNKTIEKKYARESGLYTEEELHDNWNYDDYGFFDQLYKVELKAQLC